MQHSTLKLTATDAALNTQVHRRLRLMQRSTLKFTATDATLFFSHYALNKAVLQLQILL
jgi:hypothetical protein